MTASFAKRRNLECYEIYQGSVAADDLVLDASQHDMLRKWSSKNKWELGSFSSVMFTPTHGWGCALPRDIYACGVSLKIGQLVSLHWPLGRWSLPAPC